MNEELRQRIIERLKRGEELPREWAQDLFPPEKMEYELVYHGKEREGDIIANTMAVPLQEVRTFGRNGKDDWHNMLILGDNLQVLKRLVELKKEGRLCNADGSHGVRLVYIDPPFATQQEFKGSQDQKAYRDKVAGAQFVEFLRKRLILLRELLSDDGSIYVHLDQRKGAYIKCILDEVFGESKFTNEIIWRSTDPHNNVTKKYGNIHQTLYFYKNRDNLLNFDEARIELSGAALKEYSLVQLKDGSVADYKPGIKGRRFKLNDATVPSVRRDRQFEWRGAKPSPNRSWPTDYAGMEKGLRSGIYYLRDPKKGAARCKKDFLDENLGQIPQDIWSDCGSMKGGSSYPTEKPEELLARIIKVSSSKGDIVLDAFIGSGTTIAVAEKLERRWIGIDRGKFSVYMTQNRLLTLRKEIGNKKGKTIAPKPFTLYNAGLYDFATLQKMPRDDWRFFALQLFECKDEKHKIGGLELDGKRRGSSVLVFNHHEYPNTKIDEEAIRSIHRRIGDRIGRSFYIIAPRHTFAFQQDYISIDDVKYYALRIPYSFINELHRREFSALQQPKDETAVNDLVDAEGFDFIQPPTVKFKAGIKKRKGQLLKEAFIKLDDFQSKARVRGGLESRGMDAFSMLLLDLDYNGEVFQLHTHLYAKGMEAADWHAWFPAEAVGKQVMAVFMDIYGNESNHVISREALKLPKKKKG